MLGAWGMAIAETGDNDRPCLRGCTVASLAVVVAMVATVGGVPAQAETLRQALSQTYKSNPRLDAERARLRATDEEVPRAMSGYRPQILGTADVGYQNTRTRPAAPSNGDSNPRGYGVQLTQPVFSGFRTTNQLYEAEATVRAGRENLRSVEQQVLLEAVTAYVDVVRDQAVVRLRENNVVVLTRELRAVQDRFAVGEVTRTDVAQSEARRSRSVSGLDLARANLRTSRGTYERVVGNPPSNLTEPALPMKLLPKSINEAIATATRENPAIVGALYREQAARHTVDRIWGELLPTVQVEASYNNRFDTSRSVDEVEQTVVTGRMTVPIYEGGEVRARVRQSKHTHVSRLQEVEQARSETQEFVVAAWARYEAARAQLESDQAQVNANRIALAGVREEERVGQRTILDVLNAEQELLDSEVLLVTTRRNLVVAAYALLATIGHLTAQDLGVSEVIYDPEEHYFEVRRKWFGISITHRDGREEKLDLWPTHGNLVPMK